MPFLLKDWIWGREAHHHWLGLCFQITFWKELEYANVSWAYTDISSWESGLQGVPWYLLVYVGRFHWESVNILPSFMMERWWNIPQLALLYSMNTTIREVMLEMSWALLLSRASGTFCIWWSSHFCKSSVLTFLIIQYFQTRLFHLSVLDF